MKRKQKKNAKLVESRRVASLDAEFQKTVRSLFYVLETATNLF